MQEIDLQLDTENELIFKVTVEGTSPADPRCRLVVENSNMSHMFNGEMDRSGEVTVLIPSLEKILREGTYDANLEVIVDDRVFVPLSVNINFEKSMRVTAEAVNRKRRSTVVAKAELITDSNKAERPKPVKIASPQEENTREPAKRKVTKQQTKEQSNDKKKSKLNNMDIKNLSENQIRDLIKRVFLK